MATSEMVRVGAGAGSAHAEAVHLASLASHPRARVVALCGRNRARTDEVARRHDIPRVFADYRELIEMGGLDARVVAAPDDGPHPMTPDALDAGPPRARRDTPGPRRDAGAGDVPRAEGVGVKHLTYFTWRWLPSDRHLCHLVTRGCIGRVFHADLSFLHGFGRAGADDWRFDRRRANGALADLGSHPTDLAQWLIGDVARVSCRLGAFVERKSIDGSRPDPANDAAPLLVGCVGGGQGVLTVGAVAEVAERRVGQRLILQGGRGALEGAHSVCGVVLRGAPAGPPTFVDLPIPDDFRGDADRRDPFDVLRHQPVGDRPLLDAILDDRPSRPGLAPGVRVQRAIDAAIEADRCGRRVELRSPIRPTAPTWIERSTARRGRDTVVS